jgi:putative transposase
VKGPWPAPVVDSVEAMAAKYAEAWPAWGHRKIGALMRADGHLVSTSTVERASRRRGLLLPRGFRADRKSWAVLRRRVFHDRPRQRNRVWQTDFSEFETSSGAIWRICAVIDYATKYCLAATITPTARGQDAALACLTNAVRRAERLLGLDDLRADRGELDLLDETTGELLRTVPAPIAVISDNGPCFRGATFAEAFTGDDPLLRHVRTRVKSPQTNGVIERFFGTLKYEHLFRGPSPTPAPSPSKSSASARSTTPSGPTKPSPTAPHATPTSTSTAPSNSETCMDIPSVRSSVGLVYAPHAHMVPVGLYW